MMNAPELKTLLAAATPGPWKNVSTNWSLECKGDASWLQIGKTGSQTPIAIVTVKGAYGREARLNANAALIAIAPDLATEVLRLRKINVQLVTDFNAMNLHGAKQDARITANAALVDCLKDATDSLWFAERELRHAGCVPEDDLNLIKERLDVARAFLAGGAE
jgi:hypothetical protein